jgi:hypothetical protein
LSLIRNFTGRLHRISIIISNGRVGNVAVVAVAKVLNIGRGHGRGRVKDFAISAVMAVALRITVVTV